MKIRGGFVTVKILGAEATIPYGTKKVDSEQGTFEIDWESGVITFTPKNIQVTLAVEWMEEAQEVAE